MRQGTGCGAGSEISVAMYVLIPGAGGVGRYWYLVAGQLRERGHEAVAVDLPAGDDAAGLTQYADTVVEAIGSRTDVILVAQSLGGFTAPLVCQRLPVSLLVLVNAMIPAPGETGGDWWANTGQPQARGENNVREGRPADAAFDLHTYFLHDVPADIAAEVFASDGAQSDTPMAQPWPLTRWPQAGTRVVIGRDDRFLPAGFQHRVARHRLGIAGDEIPGGHLVALSQPAALVEQLEAYRREITPAA